MSLPGTDSCSPKTLGTSHHYYPLLKRWKLRHGWLSKMSSIIQQAHSTSRGHTEPVGSRNYTHHPEMPSIPGALMSPQSRLEKFKDALFWSVWYVHQRTWPRIFTIVATLHIVPRAGNHSHVHRKAKGQMEAYSNSRRLTSNVNDSLALPTSSRGTLTNKVLRGRQPTQANMHGMLPLKLKN